MTYVHGYTTIVHKANSELNPEIDMIVTGDQVSTHSFLFLQEAKLLFGWNTPAG
jgi:hypothetical protein